MGKDSAIVLILPELGEAEARRYAALVAARDAVTDLAAWRVTAQIEAGTPSHSHLDAESAAHTPASSAILGALGGTYGGLHVKGRVATLMRGQLRRLTDALEVERRGKDGKSHKQLVETTDSALLAIDSGVRAQGIRDSQAVARRAASVAEDAATLLAARSSASEASPLGAARVDAAFHVLTDGGRHLHELGDLGKDLGENVAADLRRFARAREAHDDTHAELVLRDLAARLRSPNPSFSGGGGQRGVEAGASGAVAAASRADDEVGEGQDELEQLTQDHRANLGEVRNALDKALSSAERTALASEARAHSAALREAIKQLPPRRDSQPSALSRARADAEAMASELEGGSRALPSKADSGRRTTLAKRRVRAKWTPLMTLQAAGQRRLGPSSTERFLGRELHSKDFARLCPTKRNRASLAAPRSKTSSPPGPNAWRRRDGAATAACPRGRSNTSEARQRQCGPLEKRWTKLKAIGPSSFNGRRSASSRWRRERRTMGKVRRRGRMGTKAIARRARRRFLARTSTTGPMSSANGS